LSTPLPPGQYRDGGRLAAITVAMLCVVFAGDMASVLIHLHDASVAEAIVHRPSTVTSAQIRGADRLIHIARWLPAALTVAAAVPFVAWFRRSRLRAGYFAPGAMRTDKGWAVGGWIVPFAHLWMPLRVAHDIRRGSALPAGRDVLTARLVNSWWTLFLAKSVGAGTLWAILEGIYRDGAGYGPDLVLADAHAEVVWAVAYAALALLAAVAAVLVVRAVTLQQRARAAAGSAVAPRAGHLSPVPGADVAGG
jgi:hypothetical protein